MKLPLGINTLGLSDMPSTTAYTRWSLSPDKGHRRHQKNLRAPHQAQEPVHADGGSL